MSYLPITLNITNKKIVFIGGGKVAIHKLIALQQYTNNITIIAPEIVPEIMELGYTTIEQKYDSSLLEGFYLVYACTNNRELNKRIKQDAELRNIMVNVADDAELCDFISPAIYKNENISISVSSGGTDVKKAVEIRNKIKEMYNTKLAKNE